MKIIDDGKIDCECKDVKKYLDLTNVVIGEYLKIKVPTDFIYTLGIKTTSKLDIISCLVKTNTTIIKTIEENKDIIKEYQRLLKQEAREELQKNYTSKMSKSEYEENLINFLIEYLSDLECKKTDDTYKIGVFPVQVYEFMTILTLFLLENSPESELN